MPCLLQERDRRRVSNFLQVTPVVSESCEEVNHDLPHHPLCLGVKKFLASPAEAASDPGRWAGSALGQITEQEARPGTAAPPLPLGTDTFPCCSLSPGLPADSLNAHGPPGHTGLLSVSQTGPLLPHFWVLSSMMQRSRTQAPDQALSLVSDSLHALS